MFQPNYWISTVGRLSWGRLWILPGLCLVYNYQCLDTGIVGIGKSELNGIWNDGPFFATRFSCIAPISAFIAVLLLFVLYSFLVLLYSHHISLTLDDHLIKNEVLQPNECITCLLWLPYQKWLHVHRHQLNFACNVLINTASPSPHILSIFPLSCELLALFTPSHCFMSAVLCSVIYSSRIAHLGAFSKLKSSLSTPGFVLLHLIYFL